MKQWKQKNIIKMKRIGKTAGYTTRRGVKPYITKQYDKETISKLNDYLKQGYTLQEAISIL